DLDSTGSITRIRKFKDDDPFTFMTFTKLLATSDSTYLSVISIDGFDNEDPIYLLGMARRDSGFNWLNRLGTWPNLKPYTLLTYKSKIFVIGSQSSDAAETGFIHKFDSAGNLIWAKKFKDPLNLIYFYDAAI